MAEDFISKFNRLLGDRAGIPASPTRWPDSVDINRAARLASANKPAKTFMPKRTAAKKATTGLNAEGKRFAQQLKDLQERKIVEDAISQENPIGDALGDIGGGFMKVAGGIFRRAEASLAEPFRRVAESVGEGEPGYSMLDDLATGVVSGLVHGDTTWGETVEEAAENSVRKTGQSVLSAGPFAPLLLPSFLGAGRDQLAKEHPDLAKAYGLGASVFGTVVLDPLNVVGGKVVSVAAKTGQELTEAGIRELTEQAAKKAAKTHLPPGTRSVSVPQGPGLGNTFVNPVDKVAIDTGDTAVNTVLEVTSGAQQGKIKYGSKTFSPTVTNNSAEAYRTVRLSKFEKNLERWQRYVDGTGPSLSVKQMEAMAKADPEFKHFIETLMKNSRAARSKNPPKTLDDLMTMMQGYHPSHLATQVGKAADATRATIADEVARYSDDFAAEISKFAYNAPGIRLRGINKTLPFKRVGRAYAAGKEMVSKYAGDVPNPFSYESKFQGRLSILSQKVRSMGVKPFEELKLAVQNVAKGLSKEQRIIIADAIDAGVSVADPKLEAARIFIREQYDKILDEEVGMGVRSNSARIDNYAFVFNKGGSRKARNAFKDARRTAANTTKSIAGHTRAEARKAGLKPVDDPFEALLLRKADSNRSMTRAWFREDLLNNYGLMTKNLSAGEIAKRGLHPYQKSDLPVQLQKAMHPHDTWYIPKEMHKLYEDFETLTKLGSEEGYLLANIFDNLTNKFKFLATVPNTGFHVRNMIGDIYMGFLDGVRSKTYSELFSKIQLSRAGKNVKFHIAKGLDLSYSQLNDLYMRHAAGSRFYATDVSSTGLHRLPGRIGDKLRDISEGREDFGRLAHFLHALRQEYPKALSAGKKNALDKAIEATVYRVNKYKFDYGALTAVEHNIKRIIPFYTYSRKAVPTLMEAFFLSPQWMGRTYKMFQTQQGENYENFNHMLVPDYMREIGYATLADEEEPWAIGGDLLPTPIGASKLNLSSRQDFAQSLISSLNPLLKTVPELASGRYSFDERPIGSTTEYLGSMLPPVSGYKQWANEGKSFSTKLMQNRLFGAGLPIRQITQGQQDFAYQQQRDEIIDEPFREFNKANESTGIRVYISKRNDGTDFQVKDTVTGAILYTSVSPEAALDFASQAAKGSKQIREPIPEEEPFSRQLFNSYFGQ